MGFLSLLSQPLHFLVNIRRLEDDKYPESFPLNYDFDLGFVLKRTASKSSSTITNVNGKRSMFKKISFM
ncbi:hypothetical protein BYT27DRAFT_7183221 [Phlegmacium glaucopus]|nr:hypothetical protein BYT27DRAFT_7183221 [Phlegmacium glaucopus]